MTKEARIILATIGDDSMWRKIDHESFKAITGQGVKHSIRPYKSKESMKESVDHPTEETSDNNNFESSTTVWHQTVDQKHSFPKPTVTQETIELLPHVQRSEEFYQSNWIYGVDTGGQATFIDFVPTLLRYDSVNILIHNLDENLNDKAKFFSI